MIARGVIAVVALIVFSCSLTFCALLCAALTVDELGRERKDDRKERRK